MKIVVNLAVFILAIFCEEQLFASDGLIFPVEPKLLSVTNASVTIEAVLQTNDLVLPDKIDVLGYQNDFFPKTNRNWQVRADLIIVLENLTAYSFEIAPYYEPEGYKSLEFDLLLASGKSAVLKRRPTMLSARLSRWQSIKRGRRWESPISLDPRLWIMLGCENFDERILKLRPRFAFGGYRIGNRFSRKIHELEAKRKEVDLEDRTGEIIGNWIDFSFPYSTMQYK